MFISPDDTLHSQQQGTCPQCPLQSFLSRVATPEPPKADPTAVQVVWLEHMREGLCVNVQYALLQPAALHIATKWPQRRTLILTCVFVCGCMCVRYCDSLALLRPPTAPAAGPAAKFTKLQEPIQAVRQEERAKSVPARSGVSVFPQSGNSGLAVSKHYTPPNTHQRCCRTSGMHLQRLNMAWAARNYRCVADVRPWKHAVTKRMHIHTQTQKNRGE